MAKAIATVGLANLRWLFIQLKRVLRLRLDHSRGALDIGSMSAAGLGFVPRCEVGLQGVEQLKPAGEGLRVHTEGRRRLSISRLARAWGLSLSPETISGAYSGPKNPDPVA